MAVWWWTATGVLLALAVTAGLADRARGRRRNLDQVAWIDWRTVQFLALAGTLVAASLAWHAG